jgi:hypothetical protein
MNETKQIRIELKLSNREAGAAPSQDLIRLVIDVLADEADAAVDEQEVGTPWVAGAEAPTEAPVPLRRIDVAAVRLRTALRMTRQARVPDRFFAGGHVVDWDDGPGVGAGHAVAVAPDRFFVDA